MPRLAPLQQNLPGLWRILSYFWPQVRKYRGLIIGSMTVLFAEVAAPDVDDSRDEPGKVREPSLVPLVLEQPGTGGVRVELSIESEGEPSEYL